jgi:CHAT domain-containing protein
MCACLLAFLFLIPLRDNSFEEPTVAYEHARQLFLHGYLEKCQAASKRGYLQNRDTDPSWATKFALLEAQAMLWRGFYEDALGILSAPTLAIQGLGEDIEWATLQGATFSGLQEFSKAGRMLEKAKRLCAETEFDACGAVFRAQGVLGLKQGQFREANAQFLASREFARRHGDQWMEATALLNLGMTGLQEEHYDEALNWSRSAYLLAESLHAEDLMQRTSGNQGWAYYRLGETNKALQMFSEAEEQASRLGDIGKRILWLTTRGAVYADLQQVASAEHCYQEALELARQIHSNTDVADITTDLALAAVGQGNATKAEKYAQQALSMAQKSGSRPDMMDAIAIQMQAAALEGDADRAKQLLQQVETAPESQTSMKWASERAMARLYEAQGRNDEALREYRTALATFEAARAELKNEDSQLPFVANATRIYDDYIHFLVQQGKVEEALLAADQSRARTLSQGLGIVAKAHGETMPLSPTAVARKADATLLFYWLGEKQSYLWVVTRQKTALFPLPTKAEIEQRIEHYRNALLGPEDPIAAGNPDGRALYAALITPAAEMIDTKLPVMVLADGPLCQLNFATLIAPPSEKMREAHYWIEDAAVISAPSLAMLAAAKPASVKAGRGNLLLLGDAISPDANYPQLEYAATEMHAIEKHFGQTERTVYARERAVPAAYLGGDPRQYAYIHFVSHGVASQTDPLDSAIILSKDGLSRNGLSHGSGGEDSFKLYAREIMQHPIDARLVTISACYGSGTRVYVGEGLVGLSWAFLHAGAHNAIGALWAANDRSTAQLMDAMYQGLAAGEAPWMALREAQLSLLHAKTSFRKPFYWAPFQVYTRM